MENIYAYTAIHGRAYPEFISINRDGDQVKIIVRSASDADGREGRFAHVDLQPYEARALAAAILKALP
jgi:hypothetical protein